MRGQINRALRRDRAYGQSVAAHLLESVVEQIEPQLQLANHVLVIAINVLAHAEESGDGDLLGARGPGADVAENVAHARSNVRRRDAPADAQPGRGERFRDAVDENRPARRLWYEFCRRVVALAAEGEHPVDLIPHQKQRTLAAGETAVVLVDDELRDRRHFIAGHHRPRWIHRRVDADHSRIAHEWPDLLSGRKKIRFRCHDNLHRHAAGEIRVVVVVPRRNWIDHFVAGIDNRRVRREDKRTRAAGDQHRFDRHRQAERLLKESDHRLPQLFDAVGRRIIRLSCRQRLGDQLFQFFRNSKFAR